MRELSLSGWRDSANQCGGDLADRVGGGGGRSWSEFVAQLIRTGIYTADKFAGQLTSTQGLQRIMVLDSDELGRNKI